MFIGRKNCWGGGLPPPPDAIRLYSHKNKVQRKCTPGYYNCSGGFIHVYSVFGILRIVF